MPKTVKSVKKSGRDSSRTSSKESVRATRGELIQLYMEAVGRRKTSSARVRLVSEGPAGITVNGKKMNDYFATKEMQTILNTLIKEANVPSETSISVRVEGGGIHSQVEAIRQGLARVLVKKNPEIYKTIVKKLGYLTRDARMKERRKFGLKKARKAPQWSKR